MFFGVDFFMNVCFAFFRSFNVSYVAFFAFAYSNLIGKLFFWLKFFVCFSVLIEIIINCMLVVLSVGIASRASFIVRSFAKNYLNDFRNCIIIVFCVLMILGMVMCVLLIVCIIFIVCSVFSVFDGVLFGMFMCVVLFVVDVIIVVCCVCVMCVCCVY